MIGLISLATCAGSEITRWRMRADDPPPAVRCDTGSVADPPVAARETRLVSGNESEQRPVTPTVPIPAAVTRPDSPSAAPVDEDPEARAGGISERFLAGSLDAPRSTLLAQAIASSDTALPEGTAVEDVRCRGSMCRILARYDSPQLERRLVVALTRRAAGPDQRVTVLHPENGGGSTALIYLEESDGS